jgi:hypothetical protein
MPIRAPDERENLRLMYEAIANYHGSLVNMRFTIAGLYLAATGFLAAAWFTGLDSGLHLGYLLIPILGTTITLACWIMEIRTYQLMDNLFKRGRAIERKLQVKESFAYFDLMQHQPIDAKYPFARTTIPRRSRIGRLISHSVALNGLYVGVILFWLFAGCLG